MKILKVYRTDITLIPIKDRWYSVANDARCLIQTDCGCLYTYVHKGMEYDSRSGGMLVDLVAHHIGTQAEAWSWLQHDVLFYDWDISFETTNDLLRQQLIIDAKYSKIRASFVHWGVSTDLARKSFGNNKPEEEKNKTKMHVQWLDDNKGLMIAQAIDFTNNREKLNKLGESSIEFRRRWTK